MPSERTPTELYGIFKTNVETVLTKNIFTTYLPISICVYMIDNGIKPYYMKTDGRRLILETAGFDTLLGIGKEKFREIVWKSEEKNRKFTKSVRPPGIDMIPFIGGEEIIELEVKLTVVPTHAEDKVTEMIVRQNTQFNFAERLCYYYDRRMKDSSINSLQRLLSEYHGEQRPFIVHGFWKTDGHTAILDKDKTIDVIIISDMAYLFMLLNSPLEKENDGRRVKTRIGRVVDILSKSVGEYKSRGTLTYKEDSEGSKDHLKITLYPVNYLSSLKDTFFNPRLSLSDLLKIVPKASIEKLNPERRLDASLIFTLAMERP